jgi:hypothetical protein
LFVQQPIQSNAGVVDQHVDRDAGLREVLPQLERSSRSRQVSRLATHGNLVASSKVSLEAFQPFTITPDDDDVVAIGSQQAGQLETDPLTRTGDESRSRSSVADACGRALDCYLGGRSIVSSHGPRLRMIAAMSLQRSLDVPALKRSRGGSRPLHDSQIEHEDRIEHRHEK